MDPIEAHIVGGREPFPVWSQWYMTTEVKCDVNSTQSAIAGFEDWVKKQKMWVASGSWKR